MAKRRLVAAAALVLALTVGGAALMLADRREPAPPPTTTVAVPPVPADEPAPAAAGGPADVAPDAIADEGTGAPTAEPENAVESAGDAGADAPTSTPVEAVTAPQPPARLVVVATGIAWNDDLAAAASFRLPKAVGFALPSDLPAAPERLARWTAAGRQVAVRFAWDRIATEAGTAVPLEDAEERQLARMASQWRELEAATAGVVVEPHAAAALAQVAARTAEAIGRPVLLGAGEPAAPPHAWRLDAGLLGEAGLDDALAAVANGTAAGDTLVVLLELYPTLMDEFVAWLRDLEERGVALVPLAELAANEP